MTVRMFFWVLFMAAWLLACALWPQAAAVLILACISAVGLTAAMLAYGSGLSDD